jgi:hypothetical protein
MANLVIGGDLCPVGKNQQHFIDGDAAAIFNDLLDRFKDADMSIVNLECPLIREISPIRKNGPVLGAPSECINGIRNAGILVLGLANNHIMDHGPEGLSNTLRVCADSGILTVGAGSSLEEAGRLLVMEIGKLKIAVMAAAEREFSIAKKNSWGANPLDLIDMARTLPEKRSEVDYLIVLVHGGNEHYPLPSPRLKKVCHFLVELGADVVIVQHTHCPGCFEEYRDAFIIYGQGNLLFDGKDTGYQAWNEGFVVALEIEDTGKHAMKLIPYLQLPEEPGLKRMESDAERVFMQKITSLSAKVSDNAYVETEWLKFCRTAESRYYFSLSTRLLNNRIARKIDQYLPFISRMYTPRRLLQLENMIGCESHREVIETLLDAKRNGGQGGARE